MPWQVISADLAQCQNLVVRKLSSGVPQIRIIVKLELALALITI